MSAGEKVCVCLRKSAANSNKEKEGNLLELGKQLPKVGNDIPIPFPFVLMNVL